MSSVGFARLSRLRSHARLRATHTRRFAPPRRRAEGPAVHAHDDRRPSSPGRAVLTVAGLVVLVILYALALYTSVKNASWQHAVDPMVPGWPWW